MRKPKLLIVGAGHVGLSVIDLLRHRFRIFATTGTRKRRAELRKAGACPVLLDLDALHADRVLRRRRYDAVIHLAPPANVTYGLQRDHRTRRLARTILTEPSSRFCFVYISTSGVYGDCNGELIDETRALRPTNARARRRADAESVVMKTARRRGWRAAVLRVPGIYDDQRLPIARLQKHVPAIDSLEDGYTNHVHTDDLACMCAAALRTRRGVRIYNASDDTVLKMGDWFDRVADALNLERPPRLPRAEVERRVSPLMWSFMRESRRLSNARIKRELGVRLRWPTVDDFLEALRARRESRPR